MRISQAFPSQYLKASDLQSRRVRVVMNTVNMEDLGGDLKPILYFMGKEKGLVLNKTNSNIIVAAYGDDTDAWQGQPVELYEAIVEFQGRQVPAIRVHIPRQVAQQAAPAPHQASQGNGITPHPAPRPHPMQAPIGSVTIDDEIPF